MFYSEMSLPRPGTRISYLLMRESSFVLSTWPFSGAVVCSKESSIVRSQLNCSLCCSTPLQISCKICAITTKSQKNLYKNDSAAEMSNTNLSGTLNAKLSNYEYFTNMTGAELKCER